MCRRLPLPCAFAAPGVDAVFRVDGGRVGDTGADLYGFEWLVAGVLDGLRLVPIRGGAVTQLPMIVASPALEDAIGSNGQNVRVTGCNLGVGKAGIHAVGQGDSDRGLLQDVVRG